MDTFAIFTHKNTVHKSEVLKKAGKTPKWENAKFVFPIESLHEEILMEIKD